MTGLGDLGYLRNETGDGSEPTYRMSMLPFGTYRNQDGTESLGFALPAMIHEPMMAVERLFGTPSNPGTFGQGPDAPGNADDMKTLLFSLYGGNAMNPGRMLKGSTAAIAAPEFDAARALQDVAAKSKADLQFQKSIDTDWYHAAWPDFQQFNDPTDYLGVHVTRHKPIAQDFQADRGGPLLRMDAPFEQPFTMPPYESPGYGAALKDAQTFLPGFDGTKESLEQNAKTFRDALTSRGYDAIVSQDGRLLDDAYEAIALNPRSLNDAIYSDTGRPSLFGSAIAGAESPQRMYHGTGAADDFTTFRPSESGAFGPGVYLSNDASHAGTYAGLDDGARVMPLDVSGPFASMDDYLTTLHASGRNPEAAQNALLEQGYTGVTGGIGGSDFSNVTNVFKPGSVRSAMTGETLFSDTSKPSLFGSGLNSYNEDIPQSSYASGGNVADGIAGLRTLPDYGFGPVTPTTIAGYPNDYVEMQHPLWKSIANTALDVGSFPARSLVGQFDTAGNSIVDAINDPSLANLTNAGVQSGLAMMSPTVTVASGLGGLGLAALQDSNFIPSAEAKRLNKVQASTPAPVAAPAAPEIDPVFEKIKDDPSLVALYQQIKVEQNNATRDYPGRNGDASRAEAAARVKGLQGQFSEALAKRDAAKQGIYDQQVNNAIAARDIELGRDRRFSDTEVGKVYDKLGGYAPLVAGFLPGVVSRLAYGPAASVGSNLMRGVTGASFGVGANNVPLIYNAFSTEVDNPEQRAYDAYAYALPEGHPDKLKAQEKADKLPKLNPLREQAQEELYDPYKFVERAAMGALEGFAGNELGQMVPGGIGGLFRRSSYQLPPGTGVATVKPPSGPVGPVSPVPQEAQAKLLADKQVVLPETSSPIGPASSRNLPALGGSSDVGVAPPKPRGGGRRSKSGGTKGPSKPAEIGSSENPPASPDSQTAASDELKRFFGSKQAPDLRDLKAAGGAVDGRGSLGAEKVHSGPLHSEQGGRTDSLPTSVRAGSFVVPADVVSALGENNTAAGMKVLDYMFPKEREGLHYASGGAVPIMAAGGEYVVPPESVARIGGGNLDHGHNILDQFVLNTRNDAINTLKSLPGPSR